MQMRRLERSEQSDVLFTERRAMTSYAETDRRDCSTARWIDGYPQRSAGGRHGGVATMGFDSYPLPDAVALVDFNRVGKPQGRRVGLVGGVGPVTLILHLPEIAFEPDHDLAARGGVRDRLHVDERLMG